MQGAFDGCKEGGGCMHLLEDVLQTLGLLGTVGKDVYLVTVGTELAKILP